jgi:hypothetical protein
LLGGNNFFFSIVGWKGEKKERKKRKVSLFFSLSVSLRTFDSRVIVFAPVALSLDEMMIFSSHSERTYDEERRKRNLTDFSLSLLCLF